MERVAIFPIPGMVCFPGQQVSLHVFEPRYKQMVEDCLETGRIVLIALPAKTIAKKGMHDPNSGELQGHMETYWPHSIAGGGPLRLKRRLSDGRLSIEVFIENRYEIETYLQELPYYIAEARICYDKPGPQLLSESLFQTLFRLHKDLLGKDFYLDEDGFAPTWLQQKDLSRLTDLTFRWCRLEPHFMQRMLETESPIERAQALIPILQKLSHIVYARGERG